MKPPNPHADPAADRPGAVAPPAPVGGAAAERPHCPLRPNPRRWVLALIGLACVGLGGIGVVVPGMPTTVFLLIASWCFARSCPWLEERLIRNRLFQPFLVYLEPGSVMPMRARVTALIAMWTAILVSSGLLLAGDAAAWVPVLLAAVGLAGTWCIWSLRRGHGDPVPA